jgi:hypothetical protein
LCATPYIAVAFAESRDSLGKHHLLGWAAGLIPAGIVQADAGRKTKSEVTVVLSSRYRFSSGLLPISLSVQEFWAGLNAGIPGPCGVVEDECLMSL